MVDFPPSAAIRRSTAREQFARADVPVFVNIATVQSMVVPHGYEDFLMLSLIVSGEGGHRTIHGDEELKAGDVVLTRAGGWHGYFDCHELLVRNLAIGLPLIRNDLAWLTREPELSVLLSAPPHGSEKAVITRLSADLLERCVDDHEEIRRLLAESPVGRRIDIVAHVLMVLGGFAQAMRPKDSRQSRRQSDDRIVRLMERV